MRDLCLSVGTAGNVLSSAWQEQMDRDKYVRQQNGVAGLSFLPNSALNGIFQFESAESFLAMLLQAEFYCLAA